jgi:threonine/homoserine/homoserine lactone efflux protein
MPELIAPPQHDLTPFYREGGSSINRGLKANFGSGIMPVKLGQVQPARTSRQTILGSVLCGLMFLSLITAGLALLLSGLVPALFLAVALLLVGLSPILLVWLGILLTESIEPTKAEVQHTASKRTPGTPSRETKRLRNLGS